MPEFFHDNIDSEKLDYEKPVLFKKREVSVLGVPMDFYGVTHGAATLKEHSKEIEEAVKNSPFLFVEGAPSALGNNSQERLMRDAELLFKLMHIKPTEEELADYAKEIKRGYVFFEKMEDLASKYNKEMFVVDPLVSVTDTNNLYDSVDSAEKIKTALIATSYVGMIELEAKYWSDMEKNKKRIKEKSADPKIKTPSRRNFLQLLLGASGFTAALSKMASRQTNPRLDDPYGRGENPFGPFVYTAIDYRDSAIAHNMRKVIEAKKGKIEGRPNIFYGAAHQNSIIHYLNHHNEQELKFASYAPFYGAAPALIHRIQYHKDRDPEVSIETNA